jgi:K+ transporter
MTISLAYCSPSRAMFANLGQFNKAAIRISFAGYAYPMLVLAYLVSDESCWAKENQS